MGVTFRTAGRALLTGLFIATMGTMGTMGSTLAAHHSFSPFNMEVEESVTGTVREIQWTNPHIWIWIDVTDEEGNVVTWGIEGMSPNYLARRGWTRTALAVGDTITAVIRPLNSGEPGGMFVRTELADGTVLTMGGAR
jgi:hypothetical protein